MLYSWSLRILTTHRVTIGAALPKTRGGLSFGAAQRTALAMIVRTCGLK
jgi:hypothetical protein